MDISAQQQSDARAERARRRAQSRQQREQTEEIIRQRHDRNWSRLSTAQRCDADALSVVFSFFSSVIDLVTAAQSCRFWRAAALRMPSIHANLLDANSNPDEPWEWPSFRLQSLCTSPFRRHVISISNSAEEEYGCGRPWSCQELQMLSQTMQHVNRMENVWLCNEPPTPPSASIFFPVSLTSISLCASPDVGVKSSLLTSILQALGRCCPSLREVKLIGEECNWQGNSPWYYKDYSGPEHLPFDGIVALERLEVLRVEGLLDLHWTPEDMAFVKQLASLRELRFEPWTGYVSKHWYNEDESEWLKALLTPPHRMQGLVHLTTGTPVFSFLTLGKAHVKLLTACPRLLDLVPNSMTADAVALLPAFPALRSLMIGLDPGWDQDDETEDVPEDEIDDESGFIRGAFLLRSLTCTGLTSLIVQPRYAFDEEEAEALCKHLPQLRSLILLYVGWPSLEPLRHCSHLETFELTRSPFASGSFDCALTHMLPSLQKLKLELPEPLVLNRDALDALNPPSQLLPSLITFDCSVRPGPKDGYW